MSERLERPPLVRLLPWPGRTSPAGRRWRRVPFGYATGNRTLGAFIYFEEIRQGVGADPGDKCWRGGRWRPGRLETKFTAPTFDAAMASIDRFLGRVTETAAASPTKQRAKELLGRP